ncbi:hypothetical protein VTO73DRAFT_8638 [Trametes versicolor]
MSLGLQVLVSSAPAVFMTLRNTQLEERASNHEAYLRPTGLTTSRTVFSPSRRPAHTLPLGLSDRLPAPLHWERPVPHDPPAPARPLQRHHAHLLAPNPKVGNRDPVKRQAACVVLAAFRVSWRAAST